MKTVFWGSLNKPDQKQLQEISDLYPGIEIDYIPDDMINSFCDPTMNYEDFIEIGETLHLFIKNNPLFELQASPNFTFFFANVLTRMIMSGLGIIVPDIYYSSKIEEYGMITHNKFIKII
jgi:hypothetical protein